MPLEEVGWPAAPGPTRAALRIHGRGPGVWRAMCTWGRVRAVLPRRRGVRRACPLGAGGDSRRLAGTAPGRLCDVWCVKGASGARASGESAIKQCKKDFNSESRVTGIHPDTALRGPRPGRRRARGVTVRRAATARPPAPRPPHAGRGVVCRLGALSHHRQPQRHAHAPHRAHGHARARRTMNSTLAF